jgi:hypothetical protein
LTSCIVLLVSPSEHRASNTSNAKVIDFHNQQQTSSQRTVGAIATNSRHHEHKRCLTSNNRLNCFLDGRRPTHSCIRLLDSKLKEIVIEESASVSRVTGNLPARDQLMNGIILL